jgi:hypothetical protein
MILQPSPGDISPAPEHHLVVHLEAGERQFCPWVTPDLPQESGLTCEPGVLSNESFRIEFDTGSGVIEAVQDLAEDRPLARADASWHFGEVVHERVAAGLSRRGIYDGSYGIASPQTRRPTPDFERVGSAPTSRLLRCEAGPVFGSLVTESSVPGAELTTEVRLYAGVARVDVTVRMLKHPDTEYEGLFLAMPLELATPRFWIGCAGTAFAAREQQLPDSCRDFYVAGDYVAVSDGDYTVVAVPVEAPLVQLGELTTGRWNTHGSPEHGDMYLWMINNLWYTNFPLYQCGGITLRWSITAHPGGFSQEAAAAFARSVQWGICAGVRMPEDER